MMRPSGAPAALVAVLCVLCVRGKCPTGDPSHNAVWPSGEAPTHHLPWECGKNARVAASHCAAGLVPARAGLPTARCCFTFTLRDEWLDVVNPCVPGTRVRVGPRAARVLDE